MSLGSKFALSTLHVGLTTVQRYGAACDEYNRVYCNWYFQFWLIADENLVKYIDDNVVSSGVMPGKIYDAHTGAMADMTACMSQMSMYQQQQQQQFG